MKRQYNSSEGPVTSTIDEGDLIRIATNANNEIVDYHKIFDFDNNDNPDVVIRGNEYGETKSYIGSAKTLIAFDDMAANPDTDVVSGRIWQRQKSILVHRCSIFNGIWHCKINNRFINDYTDISGNSRKQQSGMRKILQS